MFAEHWSKIVVASIAPVVVISASGLLCLAFYNRLAAIVSRLRAVQRERLQELKLFRAASASGDSSAMESHGRFLNNLAQQTGTIIKRAHLIRFTLLCLLGAISFLITSSLFNGVALVWPSAAVAARTEDQGRYDEMASLASLKTSNTRCMRTNSNRARADLPRPNSLISPPIA